MAALNQISGLNAGVRSIVAAHFWSWFDENGEDVLFNKKVLGVLSISIRVKHLEELFRKLFGPRPTMSENLAL
jgi:hypothetical protein